MRRTASQRYCGSVRCQRARKNGWRRARYANDIDYRDNQRDSTHTWLETQGGAAAYYRGYRQRRKASTQAERKPPPRKAAPQQEKDAFDEGHTQSGWRANSDATLAKTGTISEGCPETGGISEKDRSFSGTYLLIPTGPGHANSDATLAKIVIISEGCDSFANINPMDGGTSPVYSSSP